MNGSTGGGMLTRALLLIVLAAAAGRVAAISPLAAAGAERSEPAAVPLTAQNADQMVARLSDSEVRALLLEHLKQSLPAAQAEAQSRRHGLLTGVAAAVDRVRAMIGGIGALGGEASRLAARIGAEGGGWLAVLAALVASFVGAAMLERFMRRRSGLIARLQRLPVP